MKTRFGPRLTLLGNAAAAAGRVVKAAVKREPIKAPPEVVAVREAICRSNECGRFVVTASGEWCGTAGGCGCYLPAKRKLLTETCPVGQWPRQS